MDICDDIRSIGVDDSDMLLFENQYFTPHGMSYNSYVIFDEKIAIMDTTDAATSQQWQQRLTDALAGKQPDYLVVHHVEPDHSSMISWVLDTYPNVQVVASKKALAMLPQFFPGIKLEGRAIGVGEGDTLSLGRTTLRFYMAMMIHWPEVMMSYDEYHKVLFSADAFGKFGTMQYQNDWLEEGRRYYCNIVGKYGPMVQKILQKLSGLEIKHIASLHGPLLSGDLSPYISCYDKWSSYTPEEKGVLVAYVSVYGGTKDCALYLAQLLREQGAGTVVTFDLAREDASEAVAQAFRLSGMVLAAISYDAGVFPPMQTFLARLASKGLQKRKVGIIENGSWAPSAARTMTPMLQSMKEIDIADPIVTIKSRMTDADIPALKSLASQFTL